MVNLREWVQFFETELYDWVELNLQRNLSRDREDNWAVSFGFACWLIWSNRNSMIFEEQDGHVDNMFWQIKFRASDVQNLPMQDVARHIQGRVYRTELVGWKLTEVGWFKCNTDGSVLQGGHEAGCAGVFRDSPGALVAGFTRNIGKANVLLSELWGIYTAMTVAWEHHFIPCWFETDSQAALQHFTRGYAIQAFRTPPFRYTNNRLWSVNY